jgi:hypothetical protein
MQVTATGFQAEIGEDVPDDSFYARALPRDRWEAPVTSAVDRVVLVHRLREVSAQISFTRVEATAPDTEGELEPGVQPTMLGRETAWLPAIENRMVRNSSRGSGVAAPADRTMVRGLAKLKRTTWGCQRVVGGSGVLRRKAPQRTLIAAKLWFRGQFLRSIPVCLG